MWTPNWKAHHFPSAPAISGEMLLKLWPLLAPLWSFFIEFPPKSRSRHGFEALFHIFNAFGVDLAGFGTSLGRFKPHEAGPKVLCKNLWFLRAGPKVLCRNLWFLRAKLCELMVFSVFFLKYWFVYWIKADSTFPKRPLLKKLPAVQLRSKPLRRLGGSTPYINYNNLINSK